MCPNQRTYNYQNRMNTSFEDPSADSTVILLSKSEEERKKDDVRYSSTILFLEIHFRLEIILVEKCNVGLLADAFWAGTVNFIADSNTNHTCGTSAALRRDISSLCSIDETFLQTKFKLHFLYCKNICCELQPLDIGLFNDTKDESK